jgi:hypothetical protein
LDDPPVKNIQNDNDLFWVLLCHHYYRNLLKPCKLLGPFKNAVGRFKKYKPISKLSKRRTLIGAPAPVNVVSFARGMMALAISVAGN